MLDSQREYLKNLNSKYISIGITKGGNPYGAISVPWDSTASAFNMKTPDVYLSEQDIKDAEVWSMLEEYEILGCYIFDALDDYSFFSHLKDLWDVFILNGRNIKSIEFMRDIKSWFMLYIEDATLENLEPLFPKERKRGIKPFCVGFGGCTVKNISALEQSDVYLSELVVLCPQGTNERERWENIRAGAYNYYEYKLP